MVRFYAIGDVHLPGGPRAKAMDRFGAVWHGHADQVRDHWVRLAEPDDVLLLVGDLSWAMTLDEARNDLAWIGALPGRKVILKGNHDFWWSGIGRVRAAVHPSVTALQHDHVVIAGVAIAGTRGWQCPGSVGSADVMAAGDPEAGSATYSAQDDKLYHREVDRLRMALAGVQRLPERPDRTIVALHYPPMNPEHEPSGFTALLDSHGADVCVHGHLHGEASIATAFEGTRNGTVYHCVSADAVRMQPRLILDTASGPLPPPPR